MSLPCTCTSRSGVRIIPLEWRAIAQHLFNRRRQKSGRSVQLRELVRVFKKTKNSIIEQIRRRFLPGENQELKKREDLYRKPSNR